MEPCQGPQPEPQPSLADADDLARLVAALAAHVRGRDGAIPEVGDGSSPDLLRAACLTLIAGLLELGASAPPPACGDALARLSAVGADAPPEVRACRLWLACTAGQAGTDSGDEWEALAREPLWEPVRALAFRALAHYGRRRTLAALLPGDGPLSLAQADAWLEAAHPTDLDPRWADRITPAGDDLPPAVQQRWAGLLRAETVLACEGPSEPLEASLAALADTNPSPPRTYAAAQERRLAARAVAALTRSRLARFRPDVSPLLGPAGLLLPAWQRDHLRGLARWQMPDDAQAPDLLHAAVAANPWQTAIRLALAVRIGTTDPEAGLHALEHPEPTREVIITKTALLARLGRYADAEQCLALVDGDARPGQEAARHSWARGQRQYRRQEQALRTALAERRGDGVRAAQAWAAASDGLPRTLQRARDLFAANRELQALPTGQGWRRGVVQQRVERGRHELAAVPLVGDALFFRAAGLVAAMPERALRDLQTLLRQRAWVEREQRAGGGRLGVVGDLLLRLAHAEEAARAYERAGAAATERQAVAQAWAAVQREVAPEETPAGPWPRLVAAVGQLAGGQATAALSLVEAAEQAGAPSAVCHVLRAVAAVAEGKAAALTEEDLAVLRLPAEVAAAVRLLVGAGDETDRVAWFMEAAGPTWLERCPVEPRRAARRLLVAWCDASNWDEALRLADTLERSGQAWAADLAAAVQLRHALEQAGRGELEEAEQSLQRLSTRLRFGTT